MEELKELFGEDSLDFATFESKLNEKGYKLANIKAGGYVDKNKFDKLQSDFNKYKLDNDVSKYADYETVKAELEQLKTEKAEQEFLKEVVAAGVDEKFQKFVLAETKAKVDDKNDFKTCLTKYVKENPQFISNIKQKQVIVKGSQVNVEGGTNGEKTTNQKMNNLFRGAKNQ